MKEMQIWIGSPTDQEEELFKLCRELQRRKEERTMNAKNKKKENRRLTRDDYNEYQIT